MSYNIYIETLRAMRIKCLRDSRMYQKLSVSPEHWHTVRKEAYKDSAILLKKQASALWYAIKSLKTKS